MRRAYLRVLLLVSGAAVAEPTQSQPAAPDTNQQARTWTYDRRIQLHDVRVDVQSPDEQERERQRKQENEKPRRDEDAFDSETPATLPASPTPNRRRMTKDEEEDARKSRDWLRVGDDEGKESAKRKPSGWGWLADESRAQAENRSAHSAASDQDIESADEVSATGALARSDAAWSSVTPAAPPRSTNLDGKDVRGASGMDRVRGAELRDYPVGGLARKADMPDLSRTLETRARWLPDLPRSASAGAPPISTPGPDRWGISPPAESAPLHQGPLGGLAPFQPLQLGSAISTPTPIAELDSSEPIFGAPVARPVESPAPGFNSSAGWGSGAPDAGRTKALPW